MLRWLAVCFFIGVFSAHAEHAPIDVNIHPSLIRNNLDDVKTRLRASLSDNEVNTSQIAVERIANTHYVFATIDKKYYLTDDKGATLAPVAQRDIYTFEGSMRRHAISNQSVDTLIRMQPLWELFHDKLPYYGPITSHSRKKLIYTFMDLTCPYCKTFHTQQLENYRSQGYAFIYIPFLKDPSDTRAAQFTINTFCQQNNDIKERVSRAYQQARIPKAKTLDFSKCDIGEQALLKKTLLLGAKLGFAGSPMFFTEEGTVAFGEPALDKILK